jgi:putative Holliday junction resolvase
LNGQATDDAAADDRLPVRGRLAGIDFGTVRIGIAISNADQTLASPLETYRRRNPRLDDQYFLELARQERLAGFVVGLPVHSSGDESQKSLEARAFGKHLKQLTSLPVVWFDERYTTAHAEVLLQQAGFTSKQRKRRLDKLAAQILLSAFLESSRQGESAGTIEDD